MFEERRKRVLEAMGPGAVAIILGAIPRTRSRDTEYPFRQDSDFHYLTGFDHPHAAAVLRTDAAGPAYALYVQPRDPEMETWTGPRPGVEGAVGGFGADAAHPIDDLAKHVPDLVTGASRIYHVLGRNPALDARITETLEGMRLRSRASVDPPSEIVDPRTIVHAMRLVKEPAELEIMRRAQEITREAHAEAAALARDGAREYELQAALEYVFRRRGAAGPAYESIVAGGANATILHYTANDQPLREGGLVLIDAGSEVEGYASDVTRTYPVGGRLRGPGRALYEAVLDAQLCGLAQCRPGNTLAAVHDATVRRLVERLVELGLLAGDVDQLIAEESHKRYYMHNTSHWLGLDVHDVGSYRLNGEHRLLEPGMVFTVEPGLYIPSGDEKAPPPFRGIGVRIEDDVVITPHGHENLSSSIPKEPDEVELLVSGG